MPAPWQNLQIMHLVLPVPSQVITPVPSYVSLGVVYTPLTQGPGVVPVRLLTQGGPGPSRLRADGVLRVFVMSSGCACPEV